MALAGIDQLLEWGVETIAGALAQVTGEMENSVTGNSFRSGQDTANGSWRPGMSILKII